MATSTSRGADLRQLRAAVAGLQDELRPVTAEVARLRQIEQPSDDDTKKLGEQRAQAAELVAKIEAAQAAVNAELDRLEDARAQAAATVPPGARQTRVRAQVIGFEVDPQASGGYRDMGDLALDVIAAGQGQGASDRLSAWHKQSRERMAQAGMTTGGDSGFMIPSVFVGGMMDLILQGESLISEVDTEPTTLPSVQMDADESTPWGSDGVQANWTGEAKTIAPSGLATQGRTVTVDGLKCLVRFSNELARDAVRLNARINRRVPEKMRWKMAEAIFRGSGVKQPYGFLNSPACIEVAKATGQSAAGIVGENVKKMFGRRLLREEPGGWRWLATPAAYEHLDSIVLGQAKEHLLSPAPPGSAVEFTLNGLPLRFSHLCEAVGTPGDIVLYNPRGYALLVQQMIEQAYSMHLYFDSNEGALRFVAYLGGQPKLAAPVVGPHDANTTYSDFIKLAARP